MIHGATASDMLLAALACEWNSQVDPRMRQNPRQFTRNVDHLGLAFTNLNPAIQILSFPDLNMAGGGIQIAIRLNGHDLNNINDY